MVPGERPHAQVIVVGGGLAGIAATAALHARGVDVLLLEAGPALGGKLRATEAGIPRGPLVWEARRVVIDQLLAMLGLSEDIVQVSPASSARYVLRDGALRALRPDPRALLSTEALSWRDRWMIASEPVRAAIRRGETDADESVAGFFSRHFGREMAERLVFAMVNGIWAGDPERLSVRGCFPELFAAERAHKSVLYGVWRARRAPGAPPARKGTLTLRGGLASVGRAAAERLPVRVGAAVSSIETPRGRPARIVLATGEVLRARAVIVATEAHGARALLADRAELASVLSEVSYAPLSVVHWREGAPGAAALPRGFGWLAPPRERSFSLGTLFVTDLVGAHAEDAGRRRFASFVGGSMAPGRAALDPAALARGLGDELRALVGGAFGEVLHVERQPHAVAQPTLGHADRVGRMRAATAQGPVILAGSYLGAGAMRDAVETGFSAADEALRRLPSLAALHDERPSDARALAGESVAAHEVEARETDRSPSDRPASLPPSSSSAGATDAVPLVVLGATYRDVPTELRARLAQAEDGLDAPSRALVAAGYADGVVVLRTCSRVEWIVSTSDPRWAADLLESALRTRVPEGRFHVRTGRAAVHYLLRVAMGLDSVAEGEPAVGRQMVLAFERAHGEGGTDRVLRRCWRAVQQLVSERRRRGLVRHGLGVQTLVLQELAQRQVPKDAAIAVFGHGEIGRAVVSALNAADFREVSVFRRDGREQLTELSRACAAVIVCTGAPEAHLELPTREDGPLVIDVGVPSQVRSAPGWTAVSLEDLLAHPRRLLDDGARAWLLAQVGLASDRLARELATPAPTGTLSLIDEERRVFLRETLPPLLEKMPAHHADEVRRACAAFAHALIERVRAEASS
jgi:oxygen-dependent protoporphyrinogen oxidase